MLVGVFSREGIGTVRPIDRGAGRLRGVLLALALGATPVAIGAPRSASSFLPPRCPDGTFVLRAGETPLVPGGPMPDAVELRGKHVSITSGCRRRRAAITRTRRGNRLSARWARCGATFRRVVLSARFSLDCTSLTGKLRARRGRYLRTFVAQRLVTTTSTTTTTLVTTTTLTPTIGCRLPGVDFGPYAGDQDPNLGAVVTRDQVRDRMLLLRPYTLAVRSYGSRGGLEHVGPVAGELGMRAVLGAWIGRDGPENDRQVESLIATLLAGHATGGIVGSEALLRGDVSPPALGAYLDPDRDGEARDRHLRSEGRHADHDHLAAALERGERLHDHRRRADDLEGVVHAEAVREVAHRRRRIRAARPVDHVGGAELLRQLELRPGEIYGDDARRTAQRRALDDVQPHAAAAEHRDRLPRLHLRRVDDRAHAGHDAAAAP